MGSPAYQNSSNIGYTSAVTSHSFSYTGYSIAVNDLFILNIVCNDASVTITMPTGWTRLFTYDVDGSGTSGKHEVWYKGASSTSTSPEAWTTSSAASGAATLTQFRSATLDTVGSVSPVRGSSIAPNSPGLLLVDISPGDTDITMSVATWDSAGSVSSYPSSYTIGQESGNSTFSGVAASASRSTTGGDDPGPFTISTSGDWSAGTLLIRYSATGEPVAVADIDADLDAGALTLTGNNFLASGIFFDLDAGSLSLTGNDGTSQLIADLGAGALTFSDNETLFIVFDPTFLDAGAISLTGYDGDFFVAKNADLEAGSLSLTGFSVGAPLDVTLETGQLSLTAQTQFACAKLSKNAVKKIDMTSALFDLCVAPPDNLIEGDIFGYVIIGASGSSRVVSTGFTSHPALASLSAKGHRVMWRLIDGEYYVWDLIDG